MKGFRDRALALKCSSSKSTQVDDPSHPDRNPTSLWSSFASTFSIFHTHTSHSEKKSAFHATTPNAWTAAVKRVVAVGSMRRFQERVLGPAKTGIANPTSDIWLLGVCYRISQGSSADAEAHDDSDGLSAFKQDFSSRILITYRKGFDAIGDTKLTSDVGWGCMLRSSQMLVAQALLFHKLGRSWRKSMQKPFPKEYVEILHQFGDSEATAFSIHNLVQAGKGYGLAAGSWVGPYAMCRSWESLTRSGRDKAGLQQQLLPMAVYVVSGDEDGERGGAPVVCIEDASRHCFDFSRGQADWTPILLLVPLVLGLDKINPRYIPSLRATFSFPQSLGILGGRPGASTYIVGVQEDNAFYLDPHEVQPVLNLSQDNQEADTSSYHCDIIRHIPLDSLDPSLAIGFYCRDKDDFDDFCLRASKLEDESNGAPLLTVAQCHKKSRPVGHDDGPGEGGGVQEEDCFDVVPKGDMDGSQEQESDEREDEWQLL